MNFRRHFAAAMLLLAAAPAFGQGALLQGGPWQPGHLPQYVGQGSSQAVVQDGGGAGGGSVGVNPSEIGVTARGTGTPPYAGQGTGPFGTNICDYDAPTNNPSGYHFLCLSANAQGGGLLAYGAAGIAAPLPFSFNINGVPYQFPFSGGGGVTGRPIVILSSGQSNFVDAPPFAWRPDPNSTLWNFTGVDGNVGTAFAAISPTTANITWSIASAIATANPSRRVCLINVSFSGMSISHWLPGATSPNVYQNILNNIGPALAACGGATKIDLFEWWQGEGDTLPLNSNYIANFTTLMQRFWAAQISGVNWFPQETPVVIHSIASTAISGNPDGDHMNALLQGAVNADTDKRRYVYTADLPTAAYWDATNPGHMTGFGYYSAGVMSASAFLNGPGRNSLSSIVVDPASGSITFGNAGFSAAPFAINQNAVGATLPLTTATEQSAGPDGGSAFKLIDAFGGFTNYVGRRSNGTLGSPTALALGDLIVGLGAQGHDNAGYVVGNRASFSCFAAEAWSSASNHGTYCSVFNTLVGTNNLAEDIRFEPGALTIFGTTSGTFKLTVPAAAGTVTFDLSQLSGGWIPYTPTISSTAGSLASTGTTMTAVSGRFKQVGKQVTAEADATVTTVGTASGTWSATLPVAASGAAAFIGSSFEVSTTKGGSAFSFSSVPTLMGARAADGSSYWVVNYRVVMQLTYETP